MKDIKELEEAIKQAKNALSQYRQKEKEYKDKRKWTANHLNTLMAHYEKWKLINLP